MEELTEQDREEIRRIINEGGKVTKTIIEEKDKTTTIIEIEPVNGESTSSTVIQNKDGISISSL